MNRPVRVVQSTWIAMLALQSIGSIDMKHRLPAPRQFVAISVLWGILFLMADTGYAKFAARLSVLIVLTAGVVGPFGLKLANWLRSIANQFAVSPSAAGAATPPSAVPTPATSFAPSVQSV